MKVEYKNLFRLGNLCVFILSCFALTFINYFMIPGMTHEGEVLSLICAFISPLVAFIASILIYYYYNHINDSSTIIGFLAKIFFTQLEEGVVRLTWFSLLVIFVTGYYTWVKTIYRWVTLALIIVVLLYGCIATFWFW